MDASLRRPALVVATEVLALGAIGALLAALGGRVILHVRSPAEALGAAAAVVPGVAMADLLSGVLHWACDTFFAEDTPLIGPLFIRSFREHHRDPVSITRHGWVERNATPGLGAVPVACIGLLPGAPPLVSATALACALAVFATNQLHAWAHAASAPPFVRWLQRRGVMLSPERHAEHHRSLDAGYCVTTGWTSALLDRALEALRAPRGAG
jgi:ubiquitin-conjugating enzyme E2 variant